MARNAPYTFEEVTLLVQFLAPIGFVHLPESDPRVRALSLDLGRPSTSVEAKIDNIRSCLGMAAPSKGGEATQLAVQAWLGTQPELTEVIRDLPPMAVEGRLRLATHMRRERSPALRNAKIREARERFGCVCCEICGFDARSAYGCINDIVDVHHVEPLSVTGETEVRLEDLVVLCPNHHRILHHGYGRLLRPDEFQLS